MTEQAPAPDPLAPPSPTAPVRTAAVIPAAGR
ncbi:2-C-methyl-D-erythritol 4-phosphate cytidylyltransferase, partial [Streptomyces sp. SID11233]|nr:2-C-methyl-D-erythritol 4-phosphate cytidylyltransferase [Streptomyces sp. SID11233]